MGLDDFLKVKEEVADKDEALVASDRPGTIDITAEETGKFPFDAFEFDVVDENEWPQIWVKYPWTILGPTICLRSRDEGDDDEYIDQALDYLGTNGGTLLFADGAFDVQGTISTAVSSGKIVVMRGSGNSILNGNRRFLFSGSGNVIIRDLIFTGNAFTDTDYTLGSQVIAMTNTGRQSKVVDCVFRDLYENTIAIDFDGPDYSLISRNMIYGFRYLTSGTTRYASIRVTSNSNYTQVINNMCVDNGNLIDRGDCQSGTGTSPENGNAPMVDGETNPHTNNCDWERVSCTTEGITGYGGADYCYKLTITSSGTSAYAFFTDTAYADADLHGVSPGLTYKGIVQIYTPTTGGVTPGNIYFRQYDYDGVNSSGVTGSSSTNDEWNEVEIELTLQDDATGWGLWVSVLSANAVEDEYFYVSHVRLVPVGIHNEHEQNFKDSSTSTQISSNSWQRGVV